MINDKKYIPVCFGKFIIDKPDRACLDCAFIFIKQAICGKVEILDLDISCIAVDNSNESSGNVADVAFKGITDVAGESIGEVQVVSIEFRSDTQSDTFEYLTVELVKQSDGWKIQFYGIEK